MNDALAAVVEAEHRDAGSLRLVAQRFDHVSTFRVLDQVDIAAVGGNVSDRARRRSGGGFAEQGLGRAETRKRVRNRRGLGGGR